MTSRRDALKSAALLPLTALPFASSAAPAISGTPLAGHFTADSARLWVQATEEAAATLRYWPAAAGEGEAREMALALAKSAHHCAIADLAGLEPATSYRYRVNLAGGNAAMGGCGGILGRVKQRSRDSYGARWGCASPTKS